jgi:glutamate 5-kinase
MELYVIKVGTNVLTRPDARLDVTNISHLVDQIAALRARGIAVILVSSGAVGAGRELLPTADELDGVVRRQMLSAVGQIRLMELYRQLFAGHRIQCGQVLATKEDFRDRRHYLNMRNCLQALLQGAVVPIVNENDVVSVTELMFTDNDELAGLVATMVGAEKLVILSSVDGLFDGPPGAPDSQLIRTVDAEDESVLAFITAERTSFGRGGMETKLRTAQRTAQAGVEVLLANGRRPNVLTDLAADRFHGTRIPAGERLSTIKRFLAYAPASPGRVRINAGAVAALRHPERANSLLPVGITAIEGDFERGDLIEILAEDGSVVGVGRARYGADRVRQVLGKQGEKALVHYDFLVLV